MTDRLTEILSTNWPNLRDIYKSNQSKSYIAYSTIENYIRWFDKDPKIENVKFYCLNGDFSDGTFVVTDHNQAYADTLNESHENLFQLLSLLDYSKGYTFLSERSELQPTIINAIESTNTELEHANVTLLYNLPKEKTIKLEAKPPAGIQLHSLNLDSDLEKANSVWPHRHPGSIEFFRRHAAYNSCVGAYKDDGTLVSWLLRLSTGLLFALQTDENYFRYGYGALVIKYLSRKIAEDGFDIYAGIVEENYPSRNLFEKLGFENVGKVHWITTKRKDDK